MIMNILMAPVRFMQKQKIAILICVLSAMFLFFWLFPFGDLSDYVTSKVSEATQNSVYVQFETIDIGVLPPSVVGKGVQLETPATAPISASWLRFSPSMLDMLTNLPTLISASRGNMESIQSLPGRLGFSVSAEKLMGGDLDLKLRPAGKNDQGASRSKIFLEMDELNLGELPGVLDLPIQLSGRADLNSVLQFYPNFEEQPEGDVELTAKSVKLPPSTVPTMMGPMALPGITWGQVVLKGRLTNGQLFIDEAQLGRNTDPFRGRIKGMMNMRIEKRGPQMSANMGAYDLRLDFEVARASERDFSLILGLLDSFKSSTPTGARYLLRVKGARMGVPPEMTQLSTF